MQVSPPETGPGFWIPRCCGCDASGRHEEDTSNPIEIGDYIEHKCLECGALTAEVVSNTSKADVVLEEDCSLNIYATSDEPGTVDLDSSL